ncbi:unnamed protein product [Sympodiomycopsis kandeliae]
MKRQPSVLVASIQEELKRDTPRAVETVIEAHNIDRLSKPSFHEPPGIFSSVVSKYQQLVQKREDHRREQRRARFAALQTTGSCSPETANLDEEDAKEEHPQVKRSTEGLYSDDVTEILDVVDPQVGTFGALSDMTRSIVVPACLPGSPSVMHLETEDQTLDRDLEQGHCKSALDRHVHHLVARRQQTWAAAKRVLKGIWTFVKTPLGVVAAIYGLLVTVSAAGWLICFAGWVPGNHHLQVEEFSLSTNALLAFTGIGFIPWRIRDTYLVIRICHYRNLTNRLRRQRGLTPLNDVNDLAFEAGTVDRCVTASRLSSAKASKSDLAGGYPNSDGSVSLPPLDLEDDQMLNPRQAAKLRQLQRKFTKSCTWYRATETPTHRAFPIGIAVAITVFAIGSSLFQCITSGLMWGYASHYLDRPFWAVVLFMTSGLVCGIISAMLILAGAKHTKKTQEVFDQFETAYGAQHLKEKAQQ